MYDRSLVVSILEQISSSLDTVELRVSTITTVDDFADSLSGMEKLDSVCMQFIAIGESLKKIDKITQGKLLSNYPQIDWKGVIGFRDIIAHHYFDIDAEQVFWLCKYNLTPLSQTIKQIIKDIELI